MTGYDLSGCDDRLARVALSWLAEPGTRAVHQLVDERGALAALRTLVDGDLPDLNGLRAAIAARLSAGDPRRVAEVGLARAERLGARVITPADAEWPVQLDDLLRLDVIGGDRPVDRETRPPLCLWLRGSWPSARAAC